MTPGFKPFTILFYWCYPRCYIPPWPMLSIHLSLKETLRNHNFRILSHDRFSQISRANIFLQGKAYCHKIMSSGGLKGVHCGFIFLEHRKSISRCTWPLPTDCVFEPFFLVTDYKSNLCSLHYSMHFELFKSRFADAITLKFVANLIIRKTQFDSKEGKRERILTAMNTCKPKPITGTTLQSKQS